MKGFRKWRDLFALSLLILILLLGLSCTFTTGPITNQGSTNEGKPSEQDEGQDKKEIIDHKDEVYDVIVVGGEPEGVAAAVSAARNGAKTLLVEKRDGLGGLMTYGMLNFIDINYDKDKKIANHGIFLEFYKAVGGDAFDVEHAKQVFLDMVSQEENIDLLLNAEFIAPIMENDGVTIKGVRVKIEGIYHNYYGKRIIDATQDADVAAASGVPYTVGHEDIGLRDRKMAATLMIHLENVNWDTILDTVKSKKFGYAKGNQVAAWGFDKIGKMYQPKDKTTRLRGLNIGRQKDGSILINALQIFGVDGLDPESIKDGMERGKRETYHILNFLRENFPGFEEARIKDFPPELYIRETRHIIGEYQLTIHDVLENRDFHDRIGIGSYAVDIQATSPEDYGFVIGQPVQYSIPFRVMVPLKVENLLVVGRSASYTSLAAGSARVIPIGMTLGEAAGAAAKYSIDRGISFRDIPKDENAMKEVQQILLNQGAKFYPFEITNPNTKHWSYPSVRTLLEWGLIGGGYSNSFRLEEPINEKTFINLLSNGIQRSNPANYDIERLRQMYYIAEDRILTKERAAEFILTVYGERPAEGGHYKKAVEKGFINEEFIERTRGKSRLKRGEAFCLAAYIIENHSRFYGNK